MKESISEEFEEGRRFLERSKRKRRKYNVAKIELKGFIGEKLTKITEKG